MPLGLAIPGLGIAYLARVAFLNAGAEAFAPFLTRIRTLCVFALAVFAYLVVRAILVLTAFMAAFGLIWVLVFVAVLLTSLAGLIAIDAINDVDGNNLFTVFAAATFDRDGAARVISASNFALVVVLVTSLKIAWRFGYKLLTFFRVNNFPATVFAIAFVPDVAELGAWALFTITAMC